MMIRFKELIFRAIDKTAVLRRLLAIITKKRSGAPLDIAGLTFDTPLGTAPGCDINAVVYNTLASFGASFVIVGPALLKPAGNSQGVQSMIDNLKDRPRKPIIGAAVSCCRTTGNSDGKDAEKTFAMLYDFVDFIVLCPDIDKEMSSIDESFTDLSDNILSLRLFYEQYKPLFLQIPAGIPASQTDDLLLYCLSSGIDGVLVDKQAVAHVREKSESRLVIMVAMDSNAETSAVTGAIRDGASLVAFSSDNLDVSPSTFRRKFRTVSGNYTTTLQPGSTSRETLQ